MIRSRDKENRKNHRQILKINNRIYKQKIFKNRKLEKVLTIKSIFLHYLKLIQKIIYNQIQTFYLPPIKIIIKITTKEHPPWDKIFRKYKFSLEINCKNKKALVKR